MTFFLHGSLIPRLRCLCRPSGPEIRVFKKNKEKQKLAPMRAHTMLKLYRETGFDNASSHSGRRSFATNCIRSGVDIVSLKTLMNHASIQQTSEYVATNEDMLMKAVMGPLHRTDRINGDYDAGYLA